MGFRVAMLPVGALCFYQAHFGRTVLPKWPFWAHLFYPVFYSVSEFGRACFRQARVARAMLLPGALFHAGPFAFLRCAPKSHMRPLPHLGVSEIFGFLGEVLVNMACGFAKVRTKALTCFWYTLEPGYLPQKDCWTWVHHAIAFAIASEFCRKHPFARNFRSENKNLPFHSQNHSHSLANSFATPYSQLFV